METAVYLTKEELEQLYPNEWVYLGNPKLDAHYKTLGGEVIYHHPDKRTIINQVIADRKGYKSCAMIYTGRLPAINRKWRFVAPLIRSEVSVKS